MDFEILEKDTMQYPDVENIALTEDWAKGLIYCDIAGFVLSQDGILYLMDDCGNMAICPHGRFVVIINIQGVNYKFDN